ncbi:hypothetical protein CONLIGDRAFT_685903 [Coniochaeta ligniaria NRRL 30616]|uniref:Uncharacterized protein n=1 Tax=Coniochaeta ligniaria NRRL 30616 TaxID=1408157 RepID=A0A1J7J379_9PEZI|nr:hypothetical protein CONLIGDRAFT_685903 [Coniochaeta ligniaria NRRL 30616]
MAIHPNYQQAKHSKPEQIPDSNQNISHLRLEKLGVDHSTIHYFDESVTSVLSRANSLLDMMRPPMAQNTAKPVSPPSPRRGPSLRRDHSPRSDPPSPADKDYDPERTSQHQLPRRDRKDLSQRDQT